MDEIVKYNPSFNKEIHIAIDLFTGLRIQKKDNIQYLSRSIDLYDQDYKLWDTYSVEIYPSLNFPYRFPIVFETGGKIPRNIDWHVSEKPGNCCIKVTQDEILICHEGLSLNNFIEYQLIPYLFNQTHRRIKGYYLNERSHGFLGPFEFYSEKLNEYKNIDGLIKLLHFIEGQPEPNRVSYCFCGSGKKYRKCHREAFRSLSKIGKGQLINDITELQALAFIIRKNNLINSTY